MASNTRTPAIPLYVKGSPLTRKIQPNNDFYIPSWLQNENEFLVIGGTDIRVEDQSEGNLKKFVVHYDPYNNLVVTAKDAIGEIANVVQSEPILKGKTVDEVNVTWQYNRAIESQALATPAGFADPSLSSGDRSASFTGVSVTDSISFTLTADDGGGQGAASTVSEVISLLFGNNAYNGVGTFQDGKTLVQLKAFMDTLTKTVKTSRAATLAPVGNVGEYMFYAYPKSYGLATFTFDGFEGGFVRLKNVSGTIKSELAEGDTESDILITNSEGFEEAYYVYQSLYDNRGGGDKNVIVS